VPCPPTGPSWMEAGAEFVLLFVVVVFLLFFCLVGFLLLFLLCFWFVWFLLFVLGGFGGVVFGFLGGEGISWVNLMVQIYQCSNFLRLYTFREGHLCPL